MINVVLCDDEPHFLTSMEKLIQQYMKTNQKELCITKFHDGVDLIKNYDLGFDIIFLDVSMETLDGIETAKKIREVDNKVVIIFLTSVVKYVLSGYTLGAANYLIKPINLKKITIELDKALEKLQEIGQQSITIKNNTGLYKIYVNDIKYIETYDRKTLIHMKDKEVVCFYTMKILEEKLNAFNFIRCHSSFIVNTQFIQSIEKLVIFLTTGEQIPISQQKRKDVMRLIAVYLGDEL